MQFQTCTNEHESLDVLDNTQQIDDVGSPCEAPYKETTLKLTGVLLTQRSSNFKLCLCTYVQTHMASRQAIEYVTLIRQFTQVHAYFFYVRVYHYMHV